MTDTIRLIIITVPPPDVAAAIQGLREPLCRAYDAPWALAYPPHVTLRTGVRVPPGDMDGFLDAFGAVVASARGCAICTQPARCGELELEGARRPFLFLPVRKTPPLLDLHRRLLSFRTYRKSDRTDFEPHVTLLCDALPTDRWAALQEEVRQDADRFGRTFTWVCDNVSLFVQAEGHWVPYRVFALPSTGRPSCLTTS
jgi:2'-5' RNA ligase